MIAGVGDWREEQSGYYSVKSAYKLIQKMQGTWSLDNTSGFLAKTMEFKNSSQSSEFSMEIIDWLSSYKKPVVPENGGGFVKSFQYVLLVWKPCNIFLLIVIYLLPNFAGLPIYAEWVIMMVGSRSC